MLLSMNWIQEFVDLSGLDIDNLIHRFTLSTAEVEEVFHKGSDTDKVIAAKILSVENHPDSKKLHLLKIDAGNDTIYDCVCGAPNVREGMLVAFACAGGHVCGNAISRAVVAGYESCGMCCSEAELGISDDHSGIMELPSDTVLGTDVKTFLDIDDIVFEVDNKSLTNRPDLWGHYGIAREFAALTARELKPINKLDLSSYDALDPVSISIEDKTRCYRYSSIKVSNVTCRISPANMRIRLFYCGLRAINLLADLTNYIMLELGQPLHAFDMEKVSDITVKCFDNNFEFETLDGAKRKITPNMLMICNSKEPVAIAGVMGGLASEISDATTSLLLESANFDGVSIRRTATAVGMRTDASMRYEKVLDPEITTVAIERFLKLLTDIDDGVKIISSLSDEYAKHYDKISLNFDKKYVNRYTGIDITNEQIISTLLSLGFTVRHENDKFFVTVPSWRATKDVTINADIIEEITRIYGYDNFTIKTTRSALRPALKTPAKICETQIKDLLVYKFNLHEVNSYIWCDAKKYKELGIDVEPNVSLQNAMTPEHSVLRNSMVPSLLTFTAENKMTSSEFGMFEIGRVVDGLNNKGMCDEKKKLGIVLFSKVTNEEKLFLKLRDIVAMLSHDIKHKDCSFAACEPAHNWQHPRNTAAVLYDDTVLGNISVLHPSNLMKLDKKAAVVFAELDVDLFSSAKPSEISYNEPSKFPGMDIDMSLVVGDNVAYKDLSALWNTVHCEFLTGVKLIDVYKDAQTSITVRMSFSSSQKTLAKSDIQSYLDDVIALLSTNGINLKG